MSVDKCTAAGLDEPLALGCDTGIHSVRNGCFYWTGILLLVTHILRTYLTCSVCIIVVCLQNEHTKEQVL